MDVRWMQTEAPASDEASVVCSDDHGNSRIKITKNKVQRAIHTVLYDVLFEMRLNFSLDTQIIRFFQESSLKINL